MKKLITLTFIVSSLITPFQLDYSSSAQYSGFNADVIADPSATIPAIKYIRNLSDAIEVFNAGRNTDPTVRDKQSMQLPSYFEQLTPARQVLIVLNQERRIRGLTPFTGLSNSLNSVAQAHANNMQSRQTLDHNLGGSPWDRMDSNEFVRNCREFHPYGESIYGGPGGSPQIPHIMDSIFVYIYDDGPGSRNVGAAWGHRRHLLSAFNENSGSPSNEGVLGFGYANGEYSAINTFDQAASCGI